ncbi:MAG: RDD family protein [Runella slithyformis]|nr:MAG: RDD family protein [Runella slithyformis]TAF93811.1 MAG: RDD family protein [Runella sp.]TAG16538.1 MAG: RDD family protein [Cytophagales bacterium]TAG35800.1 MAG: RDD family protein [Cytophagia bacterium]TAF24808.1 MAG: RDD family protein [Runella slithyformis]
MSVRVQTSQNVDVEYEPASIGERILANLIDYLIYIAWGIGGILLFQAFHSGGSLSTFFSILFLFLPIAFYPLFTEYFLNGQTLGKKALKIRVVRLDGGKPTLGAYILRWLLIVIDSQLFTPFVAVVAVAAGGKGQRVGDIAAGTTVVKINKTVSLDDITYQPLAENYTVRYPEAAQLSDRDIETVRVVLRKANFDLTNRTAERVSGVLNVGRVYADSQQFLTTIINDYAYLANQEK